MRGDAGDGGDPFLAGPLGESKNGAALNITALVFLSGEHSRMPTPSRSRINTCAGSVRFRRCSKSPAAGRRGMTAGLGVQGNPRRQAVKPRRWSLGLTNLDLSDAGQFPSVRASRCPRLLPSGEPRSDGKLAGVTVNFSAGRAEPRGHFLGERTIGDCLASLRPSERPQRKRNL